jgi:hypothetical protein
MTGAVMDGCVEKGECFDEIFRYLVVLGSAG